MRRVIQISDIHFGRTDKGLIVRLVHAIRALKPDLVIFSGDITQRALKKQFVEAREFVGKIEAAGIPLFVIPGNHDIEPHHRPIARLLHPYRPYTRHFATEIEPFYRDAEIAVVAIDTVRGTKIEHGRVSIPRAKAVAQLLSEVPTHITKIIVTHHPLALPSPKRMPARQQMKRLAAHAGDAIYLLASSGVDVYLSGHYHLFSVAHTGERHHKNHRRALAVQAGTLSVRGRGEPPSFNVLTIEPSRIKIEERAWDRSNATFDVRSSHVCEKEGGEWAIR